LNALCEFTGFLGFGTVEAVKSTACVSVDVPKGFIFALVVFQRQHQHPMFEDIGMIASVKSVSVA
jgi:hypothetical protein